MNMICSLSNIILNYIGHNWPLEVFAQMNTLFGLMDAQPNSNHVEHGIMFPSTLFF
jgi:hypothetical protein